MSSTSKGSASVCSQTSFMNSETHRQLHIDSTRRGSMTSTHQTAGDVLALFGDSSKTSEEETETSGDDRYHSIDDILEVDEHSNSENTPLSAPLLDSNGVYGAVSGNDKNRQASHSTLEAGDASFATITKTHSHNSHKQHNIVDTNATIINELRVLISYSLPLITTFLLQYTLTLSSVFSVGHIGQTQLAAVSLSAVTANITGFAVVEGASTALDTLCPQAYGRGDLRLVGLYFIRCTIFILGLFVPIALVWIYGAPVLLQYITHDGDEELIQYACLYLRILIIGFPGFIVFETLKKSLQAQNIFHASTYVILIAAPLNAFLNYYLVWSSTFNLGFIGAPIAIVITNYTMCLLLILYTVYVDGSQCLPSNITLRDVFQGNWSRMLHLSFNGTISVISEWFFFEIITLCAARLSTTELAAQSVIATISTLLFQIPFAIGIATSTRVANFIGAGAKHACITAMRSGVILALSVGVFIATTLIIFRHHIVVLFTNDSAVAELATQIIPISALYQVNDYLACVTGGVLRAQGKQKLTALTSLVSYYICTLPFTYLLAFYFELRLLGLWYSMMIAIGTISFVQSWVAFQSDWDAAIEKGLRDAIEDREHLVEEAQ